MAMGGNSRVKVSLILMLGIFLLCDNVAGGNYIRRVYRTSDGLRDTQVTSVTLSPRGNVWARHGELGVISVLDGYEIRQLPSPPGNYRVYESKSGQVWSLYPNGLLELINNKWVAYPISEIQEELESDPLRRIRQIPLYPTKRDHILFLCSKGLYEYIARENKPSPLLLASQTLLEKFIDMTPSSDGGVWITGQKGIVKVPPEYLQNPGSGNFREYLFDEELGVENAIRPIEDDSGGVTMVVDSIQTRKRISIYFDGKVWRRGISYEESLRQSWRDITGRFWGTTIGALLRLRDLQNANVEREDLNVAQLFDVAYGKGGVFWIGTVDGLYRYAPSLWINDTDFEKVAYSMRLNDAGDFWIITSGGLAVIKDNTTRIFSFDETGEQHSQPDGAPFFTRAGDVALNISEQMYIFSTKKSNFIRVLHPSGRSIKVIGQLADGSFCLKSSDPRNLQAGYRLDLFDGKRFRHFMEATNTVRLGDEVYFAKPTSNGEIWVGGSQGLAYFRDKQWYFVEGRGINVPEGAICMAELEKNRLWFGYRDKIYELNNNNWRLIKGGFEEIRSITKSSSNVLWVASANGVHRFERGQWISYSTVEGLPSGSAYRVVEDKLGRIWVGTSRGICRFYPEADTEPPIVKIVSPKENLKVSTADSIRINFDGVDKWKYTRRDRLLFSWRLNNNEWSPYSTQDYAELNALNSGNYQFQVKAMDRNLNESPEIASIELSIILPWYKDERILFLLGLAVIGIAISIGVAINKHLQLKKNYSLIEKTVNERTQELKRAHEQLLLNQKMTALGTLAAGIAHDFNNILSIIKGSAQIIESNLDDKEKILLRVQRIKTAVEQGAGIVRAMLGYSREGSNEIGLMNVNDVVEETIRLLGDRFIRETPIIYEPAEPLPPVYGIKDLTQQMLLNLILNAADAVHQTKGCINIRTGLTNELQHKVMLEPAKANRYVFISVEDNGCGIPDDILSRIFDPFFTTKSFSARRGTGLGLTMVYQFAMQLKYGISVKSEVGKGSIFTIYIPVKEDKDSVENKHQNNKNN